MVCPMKASVLSTPMAHERQIVCGVDTNGNACLGFTVWDLHMNGNVCLGFTVWDLHTNRNVCLGFTLWDVHTNGND